MNLRNGKRFGHEQSPYTKGTWRKGKCPSREGELNPNARLREEDVIAIRKSGISAKKLARVFGVAEQTIREIRREKRWKHVKYRPQIEIDLGK